MDTEKDLAKALELLMKVKSSMEKNDSSKLGKERIESSKSILLPIVEGNEENLDQLEQLQRDITRLRSERYIVHCIIFLLEFRKDTDMISLFLFYD